MTCERDQLTEYFIAGSKCYELVYKGKIDDSAALVVRSFCMNPSSTIPIYDDCVNSYIQYSNWTLLTDEQYWEKIRPCVVDMLISDTLQDSVLL